MPDFSIKVEGLEEVVKMLEESPRTVVSRGFVKAAQAGANVIAETLKPLIPVKPEETGGILEQGELRDLLRIDIELDSQLRGVRADVGFGPKGGPPALWTEYGHRMVSHDKKEIGNVEAHPFMRPAADSSAEAAIDAFAESLKETVSEEFPQRQVA